MNTNSSVGPKVSTNVSKTERIASILAGSMLIYNGIRNKSASQIPLGLLGGYLLFRGATGHCELYKAAGKSKLPDTVKNVNILTVLHVNRPRAEVYAFWRKLSNLPLFMRHLEKVEEHDAIRSHWKAKAMGVLPSIEWDAEVVKEIEGELIGWNSLPGATIHNAGKVEFKDSGEGTELKVLITYRPPLGDVGEGIASMFNPMFTKMIEKDVRNFKRYMETGENPMND